MHAIADFPVSVPSSAPSGQPPKKAKVTKRVVQADARLQYFLYVPEQAREGAPVLVSVHGISRNAKAHARAFAPFADRYGVVIVAPLFSHHAFPGYQRLGGTRPDLALNAILWDVTLLTGARTERVHLFGYSGGGQFAHRYAMMYPQRVLAVAMGAPGWYTYPLPEVRFPRGLARTMRRGLPQPSPDAFLRVPMAVFVGQHDDQRDAALKKSRRIDAQQGVTRLERGRRWIEAMRSAAAAHRHDTRYVYGVLPECGHSFRGCMQQGNMGWYVFEFLFGSRVTHRCYQPLNHLASRALIFNAA